MSEDRNTPQHSDFDSQSRGYITEGKKGLEINEDEIITHNKISYLWKTFEAKGKTFKQLVDEHEYIKDPQNSLGYQFMLFHMSDTYFFLNELSKAQPTSLEEHNAFNDLNDDLKAGSRKVSKTLVGLTFTPYVLFCLAITRGLSSKVVALYLYYVMFNPIYDYGQLLKMLWSGPDHLKGILNLDENKSFSKIQTQLFLRHCAKSEVMKALDVNKKYEYKPFSELIMVRIMKNSIKGQMKSWKRGFTKMYNGIFRPRPS